MSGLTIDTRAVFVTDGRTSYCRAIKPGSHTNCTRASDHDGRHACINLDGEVLAVWGPDVHAHLRPIVIDAPTHRGYSQRMAAADHVHTPDGVCIKRRSGRRCPRPRVVAA